MRVSLPMYDTPRLNAAHDAFWASIRASLGYGPDRLDRDSDVWDVWTARDLLLSQTCGLPFRARLSDQVQIVCTPDYGLPDCPPGFYQSYIVARSTAPDDLSGFPAPRFARNDPLSQSGWGAPWRLFQQMGITPQVTATTASHAASAMAVVDGKADLAAIDAMTWRLLSIEAPDLTSQLNIVARTAPTPGLPYITGLAQDAARLRQAVEDGLAGLDDDTRAALEIRGFVGLSATDYLGFPVPPLD